MKKTLMLIAIITAAMLLMPLSVISGTTQEAVPVAKTESNIPKVQEQITDTFRLYDPETEKITEISRQDYLFGVIAAEMPALYETEALKAQAVAAYTYACYNRELNKNEKYDLSTDPSVSQCYIAREEAEKKWGSKAEEYSKKIESVIADTENYLIRYNGEIILSVYHAISSGKTENSGNVWGRDYPYLKAVDSSFDKQAENYTATVSFTTQEIKEKIGNLAEWSEEPKEYFGKSVLTDSGYVKQISVCGSKISGSDIRACLDLRSTCFTVSFKDDKFTFTTYGYGHGVGMSQNGANTLAKEGKDFKEILLHYYTGCTVENY